MAGFVAHLNKSTKKGDGMAKMVFKRKTDKKKKGSKWIVRYYDHAAKRWRNKTAYTDRDSSLKLYFELKKKSEQRAAGLVDAFDEALKTPIAEVVEEFIASVKALGRSPRYLDQLESRINATIAGTGATRLHELDSVKIERYLARQGELGMSGTTRAEYITSIKSLTRWAFQNRRLPHDPLANLKRPSRKVIEPVHLRRALAPEEAARLLDAAVRRPLIEMQTVRTGKNKGKPVAKVTPRAQAKAKRIGAERRLAYLIAFFTGLRRNEIKALQWGDIVLDSIPARIQLRAKTTKSKRADSLPLHPQLAEALTAARPADVQSSARVLRTVPDMKAFRADLELAGIQYETDHGFADFHALRVSNSTMLASSGVSPRAQQALMRHTDPRTTSKIYTDEKLLPLAAEMAKVPSLPDVTADVPEALPLRATGTDDSAAVMQRVGGTTGHSGASSGTDGERQQPATDGDAKVLQTAVMAGVGIKRKDPAPSGTGSLLQAGEGGRTLDIHVGNVTLYH
jgi:integrase